MLSLFYSNVYFSIRREHFLEQVNLLILNCPNHNHLWNIDAVHMANEFVVDILKKLLENSNHKKIHNFFN